MRIALIVAAAVLALTAPAAQARAVSGKRLCERKYDTSFKHWASDPIGSGAGRLSYNYRFDWIGRRIRLCVVAIRADDTRPRHTGV